MIVLVNFIYYNWKWDAFHLLLPQMSIRNATYGDNEQQIIACQPLTFFCYSSMNACPVLTVI